MNLHYLKALVQENADVPDVIREILELARTGCIDHQGKIEEICGAMSTGQTTGPPSDPTTDPTPSDDDNRQLVGAVHRLANVMAALHLEKLVRKLNSLERLGRDGNGLEFCREWWKIREEIDKVLDEVCRALLSFPESTDGEST